MSRGRGLAGSSLLMFSGTLVSRLLGMVREPLLLGAAIGINYGAANAFAIANRLPNLIHMLLAGGVLNAVLVPQIVRAMKTETDGGETYVNRMLTVFGSALAAVTVLLTAASPLLVRIYGSALPSQWLDLAVVFGFWTIPQLFFYGLYTVLGQVLNARGAFGPYMWAPALNNVVAIGGLLVYLAVFGSVGGQGADDASVWTTERTALLAGTATLGVAAQALILLWPLYRTGYRYRWDFTIRGSGLGRASRVAMWTFGSVLAGQLANIVVINVASVAAARGGGALDVPGPAAYNPAYTIFALVNSLVVVSIVTALFTRMSTHAASGDLARVRDDLSLGLRVVGLFTVFATGALMVLTLPVARVIAATVSYPEAQSIARVATAMVAGLVGLGAVTVIQRVYYAFEDTRRLFYIQLPAIAILPVGALVSLLLPPEWILVGVGASMTLSNGVLAAITYLGLRRHLPSLDGGRVLRTHIRLTIAALPAVAVGWWLLHLTGLGEGELSVLGAIWRTIVVGTVMVLLYVFALWRLDVPELHIVARPAGKILAAVGARIPGGGALRNIGARLAGDRTLGGNGPGGGAGENSTGSGTLDAAGEKTRTAHGGVVGERYRLGVRLPSMVDGVGRWAAHDIVLDRPVELLLLDPEDSRAEDVLDGARRAAVVEDARILPILDVGDDPDGGYVVTAPVTGQSLDKLIADAALPVEQARALAGEAARALESARLAGVMHLAVRPESVRVTTSDTVLITGLGVDAALLDGQHDPISKSRQDAVDLVRILYLSLTGHWPGTHPRLRSAPLESGAPVPPSTLRPEIPADLDDLCRETLAGGPDAVTNPAELVRALGSWDKLDHRAMPVPVPARPEWRRLTTPVSGVELAEARELAGPSAGAAVVPPRGAVAGPDVSDWAPHALSADDPTVLPDFDALLSAPGAAPASPRHQAEIGGAAALAALAAFGGGVAERTRELTSTAGARIRRLADSSSESARRAAERAKDRYAEWSEQRRTQREERAQAQAAEQQTAERQVAEQQTAERQTAEQGPALEQTAVQETAPEQAAREHPAHLPGEQAAAPRGAAFTPNDPSASAPRASAFPPVRPQPQRPFPPVRGETSPPGAEESLSERRVDPTPWALAFAIAGLLVLVILSIRGLTQPVEDVSLPDPEPAATEPAEPAAPSPEASPAPQEPEPEAEPVRIAALTILDPQGDGAENPELTPRALDGDPSTFWRSRRYNDPEYGMKDGIGLAVTLEQPTEVRAVELDVMGAGGLVEVRATTPDTPTEGEPLASGEMGPQTVLELSEPTETDMLVLWFPRLPTADSDGLPRIELAEIRVR